MEVRGFYALDQPRLVDGGDFKTLAEDTPDILAATDILLMPSTAEEAFPYSTVEAMCASRLVIASRKGALVEMLGREERGFLVEGNDIDGFASTCARLIEQPELSRQPVARARAFAAELTISNHVREVREVYEQVLAHSVPQSVEAVETILE
jgi:glycosyltransferase involved in cell wall biosynthesis